MPGPMEGIRVVEIGVYIAGPAAAGILADWGADVIKIEPPLGDPCRMFHPWLGGDLPSNPVFELDNRGKRSIALDLSQPDGIAIARELIAKADVLVTNFRPGALERLGLDYASLVADHPRLIYASVTGYGLEGDDRDKASFDIGAYWSRAGLAGLLTPPDGVPPYQRGGMGDHPTGMSGAAAISAALYARERTGKGQMVATSLLRQGIYTVGFDLNLALLWGRIPAISSRSTMASATINHYVAGDGRRFWLVGLDGARHWPPLTRVLGHPEWQDDPRFATPLDRAMNTGDLTAMIDEIFATKSLDEWEAVFATEPDMFWARVQSVDEVLADPQAHAAGSFIEVPDEMGSTTMVATPVDFHGTPWSPRGLAPDLGEHTADVLRELGRSDEQIAALYASGAVATNPQFPD